VEPEPNRRVQAPVRRLNWTTIALIGGLVLLVLVVAYFATRGNGDQDKLTNSRASSTASVPTNEKACASKATYDLIKRELFSRAAQLRGSDQAAYDRLSAYAVVRMENPVMESEDQSTHAVNCSGSLSLDLPPGVAVVGGRRTLSSDVDYSVQPAADGSGTVVLLRNADAIITPLATLSRVAQPPPISSAPAEENGVAPQAPPPASGTPSVPQTTSTGCANARSRGEIAVCGDSALAALDRDMSIEYGRAVGVATPEQRDQLRQTARRFYAYRDRCHDRQCMAAAYAGRVREIRDIIEGRWLPPR
jgi:hypothetical protein